jgi:hypothetical protein
MADCKNGEPEPELYYAGSWPAGGTNQFENRAAEGFFGVGEA